MASEWTLFTGITAFSVLTIAADFPAWRQGIKQAQEGVSSKPQKEEEVVVDAGAEDEVSEDAGEEAVVEDPERLFSV